MPVTPPRFVKMPPPDPRKWGVTTGCFTTKGASIPLDPDRAYSAARSDGVRRLSQQEVDDITRLSGKAKKELSDLLNFTSDKVKGHWVKTIQSANVAKKCGTFFCGDEKEALSKNIDKGSALLREMGKKRYAAFKKVDQLMVYAQTPQAASEMCGAKQGTWKKYQESLAAIEPMVIASHKISGEILQRTQSLINTLLAVLQGFMAMLEALLNVIVTTFANIAATAGFLARHPKLLLGVGVVAGLGVLGFVLKPYLAVASMVFKKKKKRRRLR